MAKTTQLTNEQVKALAVIYAACYRATCSDNLTDTLNAQRFPLKMASRYVHKLHDMRASTPDIERLIAEQYSKIDNDTAQACFDACLSMEQQGAWSLAYSRAMDGGQDEQN